MSAQAHAYPTAVRKSASVRRASEPTPERRNIRPARATKLAAPTSATARPVADSAVTDTVAQDGGFHPPYGDRAIPRIAGYGDSLARARAAITFAKRSAISGSNSGCVNT